MLALSFCIINRLPINETVKIKKRWPTNYSRVFNFNISCSLYSINHFLKNLFNFFYPLFFQPPLLISWNCKNNPKLPPKPIPMQMSRTKSKLCALFSLPQNFSRPIFLYWRLIWQKTSVYPNIKTFSSAMHTKAIIFPLLSIDNLFRKNFPNFKNPRSPPFIRTNVSQTLKI